MLTNVTFPDSGFLINYLSQDSQPQDTLNLQAISGYVLLALATCAISFRILNKVRCQILSPTSNGKNLTLSYRNISAITWNTHEGKISIFSNGNELMYKVRYRRWNPITKSYGISEELGYLSNIPNEIRSLPQSKQLEWFNNTEAVLNRFGEPQFFTFEWTVNNIGSLKLPYTVRIRRNEKNDGLIVEVSNGKVKYVSDESCIEFRETDYKAEEEYYKKPIKEYDPRTNIDDFKKKYRYPGDLRLTPEIRTPFKDLKDLYLLSKFQPEKVEKPVFIRRFSIPLKVIFHTNVHCSKIDDRFFVGEFFWGVSVICYTGKCGNHAQIIIEGVDHGDYFMNMAEFNGPKEVEFEDWTNKKVNCVSRSELFKKESEKVKILLQELKRIQENPPERFAFTGRYSVASGGADNCYTWADNVLKQIGIFLYQSPLRGIATVPRFCLSSDATIRYNDPHPIEAYKV